ncbi:hypothetical protein ABZ672_51705 [Streptomyces mirabilis]|uniref:hypothetical protein n=1 Tax=Streptomyces mirabilis TaxID=68239 RepID=UPI000AA6F534
MAGKRKANEGGSSNGLRGDVLCVLGVLKVATADQIQRLAAPHLTYRHTEKKTPAARKEARTASHRLAANDLSVMAWSSTAAAPGAVKRSGCSPRPGWPPPRSTWTVSRRKWAACPRARAAPAPRTR